MKTWKIPVTWEEYGFVKVEANTLEEAIEIAYDDAGVIPLPDGEYVMGSWRVSGEDEDCIRDIHNNGQEDEEIT
jgi:hypothetical protein